MSLAQKTWQAWANASGVAEIEALKRNVPAPVPVGARPLELMLRLLQLLRALPQVLDLGMCKHGAPMRCIAGDVLSQVAALVCGALSERIQRRHR